jgi:light-regulated signal transduction histidine kinase (bacteriophytochrome)
VAQAAPAVTAGTPHERTTPTPPHPVDLTNCDREPIHIPGTIQPHGILFALSVPHLRVIAVSANATAHLARTAEALLEAPFAELTDEASFAAAADVARQNDGEPTRLARIRLNGMGDTPLRALLHNTPQAILLEAKLPQSDPDIPAGELFERFDRATRTLRAAGDVVAICARLAEEVHRLTGYDRVKVYRFAPDWSGEVVAETNRGNLPSYLGLHFPAADIPVQARALYVRNPERQIPDIRYVPVPLLQVDPAPIDLSAAVLRSVSPIHVEYLTNMGVGASMSVSILRHGALWGLVACHHATPHYVPPEIRQACVLLGQLAAWQLVFVEEAEIARRTGDVKAIETAVLQEATAGQDYREALLRHSNTVLDLLQATGLALSSGGSVTTLGETPEEEDLRGLFAWLSVQGDEVFQTDHLAAHYPPAAGWPDAAGVLAVSLGGPADNMMLWFRPELARTVTWAGDHEQPAVPAGGDERLTPRRSFAAWTEEVRGYCRPWAPHEVAAANGLRDMIVDIILRRSLQLEQLNTELMRSNQELESFAFIASHDLAEPLRQIETFSSLLERALHPHAPGDAKPPTADFVRWFGGIQASSRRLRTLIRDLAEYSRVGRHARPLAPASLGELVAQVESDLGKAIEESSGTIETGPLPVVMCDAAQMRQVLQNLITNALKYRHRDRAPAIRITATTRPAGEGMSRSRLPVLDISVADNGLGFDNRHAERIFEPFQRLHSSDAYPGSGIGLAICRKVVERHGGAITASGTPGQGSVFTISLPLRPLPA